MSSPGTVQASPPRTGAAEHRAGKAPPHRVPYTPPSVPTPPATRHWEPAIFAATLVLSDIAALVSGVLLTYWLRFRSGWFPTPLGIPDPAFYIASLAVVVPIGLGVAGASGMYRPHRAADAYHDLVASVRTAGLTCVLLAALAFFYRDFSYSRTFLVGFGLTSPVLLVAFRRLAGILHRRLRSRGIGVQRVAVVGGGEIAERLAEKIRNRPGSGLEVVAVVEGEIWERAAGARRAFVRAFARAHRVDRIVVTDAGLSLDDRLDMVEACHGVGVRCEFVPDLFEVMLGRVHVEEIDGVPLVGSRLHPLGRIDRVRKRALDLVVTSVALVLLAPLLALISLAVRLDSPGPVIFRQRRLGRDGRGFDILKFRSMSVEAERDTGPVRARRGDDRTTRVGRILRRTSLDELPQLWNVLRGEMSLVGPRPEREFFVEEFQRCIPRYLERHGVKSGLTGWAQVHGLRGDTSIEERTRYDIWYVEHWSVRLDLKILVLTFFRFLFQEEAY